MAMGLSRRSRGWRSAYSLTVSFACALMVHGVALTVLVRPTHKLGIGIDERSVARLMYVDFSNPSSKITTKQESGGVSSSVARGGEIPLTIPLGLPPAGGKESITDDVPVAEDEDGAFGLLDYWPTESLDERPSVLTDIPPNLPELSGFRSGGKLIMQLKINLDGRVDGVDVIRADVPEPIVTSTRSAFLKAQFVPGLKNGRPVGSLMRIEVTISALPEPTK